MFLNLFLTRKKKTDNPSTVVFMTDEPSSQSFHKQIKKDVFFFFSYFSFICRSLEVRGGAHELIKIDGDRLLGWVLADWGSVAGRWHMGARTARTAVASSCWTRTSRTAVASCCWTGATETTTHRNRGLALVITKEGSNDCANKHTQ